METKGKNAVVVGGASGMGKATAQALAAAGAKVAILDREASDGKKIAEEIGGIFHAIDITDFEGAEQSLAAAVAELGGLHIAVNTAGGGTVKKTLGRGGPHDLETFRQVVDLNLVATFNLNRLQAAHMSANAPEDSERGVIVNTSSIAAFEGQIGQVAYTASKAGIAGMALVMARDLGPQGIRVLAIAPSLFATGATAAFTDEQVAPLVEDAAFPKRMGRPEEYAKLALAIVENQMLNGQCLRLDAGQRFAPR
ncbi:3-hydroxy-2-methylbutyryl-CoA dehydrogenase [Nocardia nova]|uniref:3-hydroxy-2-methylbutyryl-CoA dehydrogenase n=1 Tax=Nocardia nova TaxID=37330 RepID=A0A2S6AQU3_9NOCA|nr:SDR family NAD(P)-dependent oxidoreductase [Nocardia nova]PPJ26677.1 3-hydroxy-2-methylbutyryl-CoA dehydrogenase [Nocardia nova]PPJ37556.1 3-hydroxy-2-methylbutyryl-CoA dehydrogenase [Nocardia nova]